MDGLRELIAVDNYEAVKVGGLQQETKSKRVTSQEQSLEKVRQKLYCALPSTHQIWKIKDGGLRWSTWIGTLFARLLFRELKDKSEESCITTTRTRTRRSWGTQAKVSWAMKEAKDRGEDYCDPNHQKEIETRDQIRLNLWAIHLKSPAAALAKALECLEQGEGEPLAFTDVSVSSGSMWRHGCPKSPD